MGDLGLGRLETLQLRTVWPNEPEDFTPWLAEHLELLGGVLNLNLREIGQEEAVGPFSVDILAEDPNVGRVVIENQLTLTDHKHLGQLLTYAAGQRASVLIWIAERFQDEHRAALELLEDWSPDGTLIFGVEVRVVKIGDSSPAPEFRPVVSPNAWMRESRRLASTAPDMARYREFWGPLRERLSDQGIPPHTRRGDASSQSFKSAPPTAGIVYFLNFAGDSEAEVQFYIDTDDITYNKRLFDELQLHQEQIEMAVDETLRWDRRDDNRASMIRARRQGSLNDPHDQLDEIRDWMVETLVNLKGAIDPLFLAHQGSLDAEEAEGVDAGSLGDDND